MGVLQNIVGLQLRMKSVRVGRKVGEVKWFRFLPESARGGRSVPLLVIIVQQCPETEAIIWCHSCGPDVVKNVLRLLLKESWLCWEVLTSEVGKFPKACGLSLSASACPQTCVCVQWLCLWKPQDIIYSCQIRPPRPPLWSVPSAPIPNNAQSPMYAWQQRWQCHSWHVPTVLV